MIRFAVIDGDGWVLRFGSCHGDDLERQAGEGETAIKIERKPVMQGRPFRLIDGELVEQ